MKNKLLYKYRSKMKLKISGKNIERFIKRLVTNNIELLEIKYINRKEVNILIYKDEYEKVMDLKTIYDVTLLDIYGIIKIQKTININKFLIMFFMLGIALIIFLSNIIFEIEIVYNDLNIRKFLQNELSGYGIKEYSFKKSFKELQTIKEDILEKYNDKFEWLEIETVGTKYVIRLEERKTVPKDDNNELNHIVAKKSAIIKNVISSRGDIIKTTNEYVNKGDIIISGNITLNNNVMKTVGAKGEVFGEVWYETTVEYPFIYAEVKETGNRKNKIVVKLFNNSIELGKKFKEKKTTDQLIFGHSFLPIGLYKQEQKEIITISDILTFEEARDKAIVLARQKVEDKLKEKEYIIDEKVLDTKTYEDKIELRMFYSVYENITEYAKVESDLDVQGDDS